jgi:hypothetical protein
LVTGGYCAGKYGTPGTSEPADGAGARAWFALATGSKFDNEMRHKIATTAAIAYLFKPVFAGRRGADVRRGSGTSTIERKRCFECTIILKFSISSRQNRKTEKPSESEFESQQKPGIPAPVISRIPGGPNCPATSNPVKSIILRLHREVNITFGL